MLLTIIVPSYNQNRFIERTLESIYAQNYRPLEVIVVDGASTDGTVETLRQAQLRHPDLRWLSEPDNGPADAVNKGLALAGGEIAAIQSSDDIYYPGAFSAAMAVFLPDADCGFLIGDMNGIDEADKVLFTERLPPFSWEAYFARCLCIPQSSIFFRMDVARAAGGWNGRYYGCDLDYWMRLLLRTRAMHIPTILSGWRVYGEQRTHNPDAQSRIWHGYWQMIEDSSELRCAPRRVRRLAKASRHLMALRFHPTRNPWVMRWHLLLAFLLFPSFWRYDSTGLLRWLPGGRRIQRWRKHGLLRAGGQ